ncbi:hypothetical protein [Streptomyces sp. NPDC056061]|uniref:hypothetical protein n=1 Tax=Streptomyces sp. NPDC056061 TaxID=3345700 RepID=UPI0035E0750B
MTQVIQMAQVICMAQVAHTAQVARTAHVARTAQVPRMAEREGRAPGELFLLDDTRDAGRLDDMRDVGTQGAGRIGRLTARSSLPPP